ncbi:MAG: 3-beta hydroxysteroid dehydrogenase [Acidocella sp. 20-57-95]|nr:MAG: 3-beta hydroxysteroid dehydrogenase [Acidocella sp. 20-57-95]OYV59818.1 MAG: 3-beta hydroxysteroid dehydrogenase [Acidocella sp. 21-58-7]HQT62910.1 SDR family oxidoreductase [Acidocella sp.]
MNFEGQTVVITGASRGIGFGIAKGFAKAGAHLLLLADDPEVIESAYRLSAVGKVVDITLEPDIMAAFDCLSNIDVLINNAGLEHLTPLDDTSPEAASLFRRIIDINITGTYLVTRAALPKMRSGARIISTSSVWGRVGEPLFSAYVASKHAIIGLTKSWAKELGPRGINVNAVAPGWVKTAASLRSLSAMAARGNITEDILLNDILQGQALPGFMEPEDMAGVYMFLASPYAANITGQTIGADRGEMPW